MGQPFRFIQGHVRSPLKGPNRFKLRCGTAVIFLERREGTVLECLVSRKDFDRVRKHHWYANRNGKRTFYAAAWIDGAQVYMHKYLCPGWPQVNHENGNGLDNRRENLRGVRSADGARRKRQRWTTQSAKAAFILDCSEVGRFTQTKSPGARKASLGLVNRTRFSSPDALAVRLPTLFNFLEVKCRYPGNLRALSKGTK
jgi:hypothetical protein